MKDYMILDIGLKAVRDCGKTNMFDRKAAQKYAFDLGFYELVSWIESSYPEEYIQLLKCIDFENTPSVDDVSELLDMGDDTRSYIADSFEEELNAYANREMKLKQLQHTFDDFKQSGFRSIRSFVVHSTKDHPLHYIYTLASGGQVYWLSDGFYLESASQKHSLLNAETWKKEESYREKLSKDNLAKFDTIHPFFRLRTLFK